MLVKVFHGVPVLRHIFREKIQNFPAFLRKSVPLMIKGQLFFILNPRVGFYRPNQVLNAFYDIFMGNANAELCIPLPVLFHDVRNQFHLPGNFRLKISGLLLHGVGVHYLGQKIVGGQNIRRCLSLAFRPMDFMILIIYPHLLIIKGHSRRHAVLAHSLIGIKGFALTLVIPKLILCGIILQINIVAVFYPSTWA